MVTVGNEPSGSDLTSPRGPGGVDWLDAGPPRRPAGRRRTAMSAAAVAAVVSVVGIVHQGRTDSSAHLPAPSSPPPASASNPAGPDATGRPTGPVPQHFTDTTLALPGAGAWELFVHGADGIYRVHLATGAVTRTAATAIGGAGPASFIAGPRQAFLRPLDSATGLLLPDGRAARALPGRLGPAEELYPGPDGFLWAQTLSDTTDSSVVLVDYAGRAAGPRITLSGAWAQSDGAHNLLLTRGGGVQEASATRVRRLTGGTVAAIGPHHYLLNECARPKPCGTYLFDRRSRTRRRVGPSAQSDETVGSISPDGQRAALIRFTHYGPPQGEVIDLSTGRGQPLSGSLDPYGNPATNLLWTPDSRLLIAVINSRITVIDPVTGAQSVSARVWPKVWQLALRSS